VLVQGEHCDSLPILR